MQEKRLTTRLTTYWDMLRKKDIMPDFATLNSAALQDVWHNCIVLKLEPGTDNENRRYYVHAVGDNIIHMYGDDPSGQYLTPKQRQFQAAKVITKAHEILDNPQPLFDEGKFVNTRSKVVKYRSVVIPFGNTEVTHLLAGLSWREF